MGNKSNNQKKMEHNFKLKDIHVESLEKKFFELSEIEARKIASSPDLLLTAEKCPACDSSEMQEVFEHQGFHYQRCTKCQLLFISPYPNEQVHIQYITQSKALSHLRENIPENIQESRMLMYRERAQFLTENIACYCPQASSLLEIGAGNGELSKCLRDKQEFDNIQITLVEPQPLNLDLQNVNIIQQSFGETEINQKFDVIVAFEVLEHITEPIPFLLRIHKLLKLDGLFILSTPNECSIETRFLGTLSSNILFDHVRLYNPKALKIALERANFDTIKIETPGRLDVELIRNGGLGGGTPISKDDIQWKPLQFLLEYANGQFDSSFQKFLQENLLSSHMRCIGKRR